jgi:hypothetical protein
MCLWARAEPVSLSRLPTGSPGDAMRSTFSENSICPRAVVERSHGVTPGLAMGLGIGVARVIVVHRHRRRISLALTEHIAEAG